MATPLGRSRRAGGRKESLADGQEALPTEASRGVRISVYEAGRLSLGRTASAHHVYDLFAQTRPYPYLKSSIFPDLRENRTGIAIFVPV